MHWLDNSFLRAALTLHYFWLEVMIQGTLLLSSVCSLSSSQKTGGFEKYRYGNNSSAQIPAEWISQLGLR